MNDVQTREKVEEGQDMQPSVYLKMPPALFTALEWKHDGRSDFSLKKKNGGVKVTTTMKITGSDAAQHVFRGFDVEKDYTRVLVHKNGTTAQEESVKVQKRFFYFYKYVLCDLTAMVAFRFKSLSSYATIGLNLREMLALLLLTR